MFQTKDTEVSATTTKKHVEDFPVIFCFVCILFVLNPHSHTITQGSTQSSLSLPLDRSINRSLFALLLPPLCPSLIFNILHQLRTKQLLFSSIVYITNLPQFSITFML